MENIILSAIIIAAVGSAIAYIRKQKKKGAKCIGCSCGCSGSEKCSEQKSS